VDKIQLYNQSTYCSHCEGLGFIETKWVSKISCTYCKGTGRELIYKKPIYIKTANDLYTVGAAYHRHTGIIQSEKEDKVLKPLITLKFNK
jgi:DnaJ-class molecular chaperone